MQFELYWSQPQMRARLHPHLRLDNPMLFIPSTRFTKAVATPVSCTSPPVLSPKPTRSTFDGKTRTFLAGVPSSDFPGVKGESKQIGRTTRDQLAQLAQFTNEQGLRSLRLEKGNAPESNLKQGQRAVWTKGNEILGL
ncbi:uncharacterized protein BP01DRAFT_385113 [Aspergillus saccharolyticus JOP 1030-1]|uniref:Uncharacterized protein n=1 Tax=Aspergillus saccharolyticus JOP 1030-1 TaxID=1450539 RepID=A0A318Z952_9EURO|nr:hypothetical protein BP01DRAFT_385113 [Aspergillus saccharolyticus JOP 1030-1]PYH42914.1 hypothetical protein BP01DRAFT_385113 [Aspergillus saccharolyticus JOP 1030-1]